MDGCVTSQGPRGKCSVHRTAADLLTLPTAPAHARNCSVLLVPWSSDAPNEAPCQNHSATGSVAAGQLPLFNSVYAGACSPAGPLLRRALPLQEVPGFSCMVLACVDAHVVNTFCPLQEDAAAAAAIDVPVAHLQQCHVVLRQADDDLVMPARALDNGHIAVQEEAAQPLVWL